MPNSPRAFIEAYSSLWISPAFVPLCPPEDKCSPHQSSLPHSPSAGGHGSTLFPWPAVEDPRNLRQHQLPQLGLLGLLSDSTSDGLPSPAEQCLWTRGKGWAPHCGVAGEDNPLPSLCLGGWREPAPALGLSSQVDESPFWIISSKEIINENICKGIQGKNVSHCFSGKDWTKNCFWRKCVTTSFHKTTVALWMGS